MNKAAGRIGGSQSYRVRPDPANFEAMLSEISAGAPERDAAPAFPKAPFDALSREGLLTLAVPDPVESNVRRASFSEEWRILRAVAKADGSVGRIFDGHLNALERVSVLAPESLRTRELEAVAAGELLLGVWGADPIPSEGSPARLVMTSPVPSSLV